ncbi:efflux RND transporter permease subunit [Methylomarinum vadi]|uniref:efflux RND transporter permease subunit n=1 Tax=Methylomarinum vadi TaxID=438855 RepID=UPI0004DF6684|nr:efflux RND transporter permease subunit [Methylomarinum vadi]
MLNLLIRQAIEHRVLILIATLALSIWGWISAQQTALDAIPDLSDVQVIIRTPYPGQSPKIVEDQVTHPIASAMQAVPGAEVVRGYSFFGDSYLYIIFKDGTDLYWARSRVLEYLNQIQASLPADAYPRLGPDASGVGWVYSYALVDRSGRHDISQLRSLQDSFLKLELQSVPGVAEVASIGGMVRQYQVIVHPDKLIAHQLTLTQVSDAIRKNNQETGGSVIEQAEAEYMIHTQGYLTSVRDIEMIPVRRLANGGVITLRDLATVQIGPEMRRAATDLDGAGEVAGGIVVMRHGENALSTITAVKKRLAQLRQGLPEGVELVTTYDRSELIENALANLSDKLMLEFLFIALVCGIFLFHLRSALIAVISLPVGVLTAFIVMRWQGVSANIMSLGGIAIAIGTMTDAAIVMIENAHKHLQGWRQQHPGRQPTSTEHWQLIQQACEEVGPALFFSLLIITCSFIPVFTLEAQEGRLFSPLAFTKTYAMAAAAILAVTLIPVLLGYLIRGNLPDESDNPLNRWLNRRYRQALAWMIARSNKTLTWATLILISVWLPVFGLSSILSPLKWPVELITQSPEDNRYLQQVNTWQHQFESFWQRAFRHVPGLARLSTGIGTEFMPPLFEGDLMYMPTTLPGIAIGKAQELLQQTNRLIASVPEVERVFGKVGRAETATDPAPLNMIETLIRLKSRQQWREGMTLEKLIAELDALVYLPGLSNAWVMPIKTRIDMMATGIKTPLGIKISGDSPDVIEHIGRDIENALNNVAGTRSVIAERVSGGRYIEIIPDRKQLSLLGLNIADINALIQTAVGGSNVSFVVEGTQRYPLNLRFPRELRDDIEELKEMTLLTSTGQLIALGQVADIKIVSGPPVYKTENARLQGWVFIDTDDGDLGRYIAAAHQALQATVDIPAGYAVSWDGQYRAMERAADKLARLIPLTLLSIVVLLYFIFANVGQILIVLLTLPFALVGGFWLMFLLDYRLSVASAVGFIALAGMAIEFGVIMQLYLDKAIADYSARGRLNNHEDLTQAILAGAVQRMRPKAMTVAIIIFGLLPMMYGHGAGSDVLQRIATPILGGMITAPLLSLFIIPVIYLRWQGRRLG